MTSHSSPRDGPLLHQPFGFYMFGNMFEGKMLKSKMLLKKKNLFEDLLEQLQLYVERLSMRAEVPVHEVKAESITEIRMEVITLTRHTSSMCEKL